MKSFEVLNAQPILDKLAGMDLPIAISVKLLDPFRKANEIHNTVVEKRAALYLKYGKHDEKTKETTILAKNKDKFAEEYTALMESELEWDQPAIDVAEFGDEVNLSIAEVSRISWFLQPSKISNPKKAA